MDINIILLLVATGVFVGVINTFASGAAALTIAVFTSLGMPINIANGTNRVPVLFQCLTMSLTFGRQGVLDFGVGWRLSVPTIIGAILGAQFASNIDNALMTMLLGIIFCMLLVTLLFNPSKVMRASALVPRAIKWSDYLWFFLIGLYGGSFHIGVGYFILAVTTIGMGYNLIEANALKGFIVLMYIPFSMTIFILNGQVEILYGIVHGVGNVIGAFLAAHYSQRIGMKFLRWFLVIFIFIMVLDLFKIVDIQSLLMRVL